jgi:hypothetical protein
VAAYPLSRGSRAPVAHKEIMDSIKGAIELCEYIEARERDGIVAQAPASAEPSSLPFIDAWVRAFHESGQEVTDP